MKDLGPRRAGTKQTEGALSIRETADGIEEGPGLGHPAAQELLAAARGANGRTKEFEAGGPIPTASREIGRPERLRCGARRD